MLHIYINVFTDRYLINASIDLVNFCIGISHWFKVCTVQFLLSDLEVIRFCRQPTNKQNVSE